MSPVTASVVLSPLPQPCAGILEPPMLGQGRCHVGLERRDSQFEDSIVVCQSMGQLSRQGGHTVQLQKSPASRQRRGGLDGKNAQVI